MVDIWGRPISVLQKFTEKPATDDIKKLIEDEIADTLNLTDVDPNEIVVFQDRQGKLKSSNVSLNDILTRQSDVSEGTMVLYTSDGKLKPGENISTITNSVKAIRDNLGLLDNLVTEANNKLNSQANSLATVEKSVTDAQLITGRFFGNPPVTAPNLATIKTAVDAAAGLRSEYDTHITQFNTLRRNNNVVINNFNKFFGTNPIVTSPPLAEIKKAIDDQKPIKDVFDKFFGTNPIITSPPLAEIKKAIDDQKKLDDRQERIRKVINSIIGEFFGISPESDKFAEILDLTVIISLPQIEKSIEKQAKTSDVVNKFFGDPAVTNPTLAEINAGIEKQKSLNVNDLILKFFKDSSNYQNTIDPQSIFITYDRIKKHIIFQDSQHFNELIFRFFENTYFPKENATIDPNFVVNRYIDIDDYIRDQTNLKVNEIIKTFFGNPPVANPNLAEIKTSIEKQKTTSDVVDKFFRDSKIEDPTINLTILTEYIGLVHRFFRKDISEIEIIKTNEIFKSYIDIVSDIRFLRNISDKIKIQHDDFRVKDIVYTINKGVIDWINDGIERGILISNYGVAGIYRFTWIAKEQFIATEGIGKVYNNNPAMIIFDDKKDNYKSISFSPVKDTVARTKIIWCFEFVSSLTSEEFAEF